MKVLSNRNTGIEHIPEDLYLAMGDTSEQMEPPESILSDSEMVEYQSLGTDSRRTEFLSSRYLVKHLAGHIGIDSSALEISKDMLGKPYGNYNKQKSIYISLAHTGSKILCGLSAKIPHGVDIEPVDRKVEPRLRQRIGHEEESLERVNLLRIWTMKESVVKLEGRGLRSNLNDIHISQVDRDLYLGRFNDDKSVNICSFKQDDYWIAVSYYNH